MGVIFSDPFNRANGDIGNGWVEIAGDFTILNNQLKMNASAPGTAIHAGTNAYPDAWAEVSWVSTNVGLTTCRLLLRCDNNASNYYYCSFLLGTTLAQSNITIGRCVSGALKDLVRAFETPQSGTAHTLMFQVSGTRLSAYVDGNLWLECVDDTIAGGDYFGLYLSNNNLLLDNFDISEAATYNLFANPNTVEAGTANNQITLTTSAPGWEEGTPGVPVFTADIGTIVSQEVQPLGTAIIVYDAPGFVCTDTIRDPLNGTSVSIGVGQAVGGDIGEILRRLGNPTFPIDITSYLKSLSLPDPIQEGNLSPQAVFAAIEAIDAVVTFATYVLDIWNAITTYPPSTANTTALQVYDLASSEHARALGIDTNLVVHNIETIAHYSLLDVMDTIRGISAIDNTNIWNRLGDIITPNAYTLGSIILAIEGVRGVDNRNLTQIYDLLNQGLEVDLSPVLEILNHLTADDTQTIQTILDALGDIPTNPITSLDPVLSILNNLTNNDTQTLQTLIDLINAIPTDPVTDLSPVTTLINNLTSNGTYNLAGINTKLDNILTAIGNIQPGGTGNVAPVWPGLGNVTIGAGVPLAPGFTVAGPLDGVLIEITSVPPQTGRYVFDGHSSWTHVGALSFVSDNGDFEPPQTFGFELAILTPKTMKRAASVAGRAKQALTGTCYPWSINP